MSGNFRFRIDFHSVLPHFLALFPESAGPEAVLRFDGKKVSLVEGNRISRKWTWKQLKWLHRQFLGYVVEQFTAALADGDELLPFEVSRDGDLMIETPNGTRFLKYDPECPLLWRPEQSIRRSEAP